MFINFDGMYIHCLAKFGRGDDDEGEIHETILAYFWE